MTQFDCKNNKSSEKFEVNEAFLQISDQIKHEIAGKTLDEAINYFANKIERKFLFSKRLKTVSYSIGMMNRIIDDGHSDAMVKISEALQVRSIEVLGDEIAECKAKVVLIAGPSSSGKTTFSKKLSQALEKHGLNPIAVSLDDYFVSRDRTPKDEKGEYDYESIYAEDIELFQQQVGELLNGGEVELPRYDFPTGMSVKSGKHVSLGDDTILIIEGIHALNPILTGSIPNDFLSRIYISGLTVAKQDDGTYFPTTDNRLIRRMIRDAKYRNTTAESTLARWASVRQGEEKWITPFQENADVNFCTAFQYELGMMKNQAIPLLQEVKEDSPYYTEAQRLIWVMSHFHDMDENLLPPYSLLREFIGGSAFEY
ncbi:MAG: hypothetical protein KBT33_10435 [Prevotellaceae bacterium]|nr:hypothetical protein [Candidatus Minthosoma equi]